MNDINNLLDNLQYSAANVESERLFDLVFHIIITELEIWRFS